MSKTIKIKVLKDIINAEYQRAEALYNVYVEAGNSRNYDYYAARLSTLIDVSAAIEQETGEVIFEDGEETCADTLSNSSPVPTSANTPAKNTTTASAVL